MRMCPALMKIHPNLPFFGVQPLKLQLGTRLPHAGTACMSNCAWCWKVSKYTLFYCWMKKSFSTFDNPPNVANQSTFLLQNARKMQSFAALTGVCVGGAIVQRKAAKTHGNGCADGVGEVAAQFYVQQHLRSRWKQVAQTHEQHTKSNDVFGWKRNNQNRKDWREGKRLTCDSENRPLSSLSHLRLLCLTCISENRSLPYHHHHHHHHHQHHDDHCPAQTSMGQGSRAFSRRFVDDTNVAGWNTQIGTILWSHRCFCSSWNEVLWFHTMFHGVTAKSPIVNSAQPLRYQLGLGDFFMTWNDHHWTSNLRAQGWGPRAQGPRGPEKRGYFLHGKTGKTWDFHGFSGTKSRWRRFSKSKLSRCNFLSVAIQISRYLRH